MAHECMREAQCVRGQEARFACGLPRALEYIEFPPRLDSQKSRFACGLPRALEDIEP